MAGSFSDFLEAALLSHAFRNVIYTPPAALYLGLFTSLPTDVGPGVEVVGGSYARPAVVFSSPVGGIVVNVGDVAYPISSAIWGSIVGFGVFDAPAGGNMLAWGELLGPAFPFTNVGGSAFTVPGSSFPIDQMVEVEPVFAGINLPAPFTDNTPYFVVAPTAGTSVFLSATLGGSPQLPAVTSAGCTMSRSFKQNIPKAVQLIIPDGTLSISLD